jgi:hypothetical protein
MAFEAAGTLTWRSVPGRSYAVEESGDLSGWTVVPGLEAVLADDEETTATLPASEAAERFFRVKAIP